MIPDNAPAARIRCANCKEIFKVDGPAPQPSAAVSKPSAGGARRPASASAPSQSLAFDDLEDVRPVASATNSGFRRSPAESSKGSGPSPLIYALLGGSGVAVVVLLAVLVVVLTRGGDGPAANVGNAARVAERSKPSTTERAHAEEAPAAVESLVSPTTVTANTPPPPSSTSSTVIDSQEIIQRLKDASIYIKLKLGDKPLSTGSGFVIEVSGDTVLLATNRHVVVPNLSELPPSIAKKGAASSIEVVFRSGLGRQQEQVLPAEIVAADLTEEYGTDLAFLRVRGVKNPPKPINPLTRSDPTEGMTYIGGGFPLGGMLNKISESKGNPSVTITGGRIAALRRDEHGHITLLQVDGSLQPGNSGGPIVEEKTGKLLGVAVASLSRAGIDTIGFIVPAAEVRQALAGRVGAVDLTLQKSPQGTADLLVKAQVVDPKQRVQGVLVHIAASAAVGTLNPNSDGSWPPLPKSTPVELQKDNKTASALGRVQVSLSGNGADARKVMIQTARRDLAGQIVYSKPKEYNLPERPGKILARGDLQRTIKAVQRKSASLLGPLIDPDKDCQFTKDEENYKFKIEIPGKLHTLSPELTTRKNRKVSLHNAPIILADVEGDFAAMVEVTGEISPGSVTPKDRQGHMLPFTVQSAGLIMYQDKNNFMRLERAGSILINDLRPVHRLIIEAVKDGKQAMQPIYVDVPEQNTLLILVRRKGRVRCMFSPNGGNSIVAFREFALDLPPKIKVGLTAGNISAKPFTANFENFAVLNDATKIDTELGE